MAIESYDRFDKTKYTTAERMAREHAQRMAERFNEPAIILDGPNEYVVIRGIAWNARDTWAKRDLPKWAKSDPESKVLDTLYPSDALQGNYAKARKLVNKMRDTTSNVRYEQNFELDEMFRDYPKVRQMLRISQDAAEHLNMILIYLDHEMNDAIEQHKNKDKQENND